MALADRPVPDAPTPTALDVVVFAAGGHRFGIEALYVRAQRAGTDGPSAPSLPGLPGLAAGQDCVLLQIGDRLVAVTPPVELCRLDAATIHPLPPLLAARCRLRALRAVAVDAAGVILLLDGDRLTGNE